MSTCITLDETFFYVLRYKNIRATCNTVLYICTFLKIEKLYFYFVVKPNIKKPNDYYDMLISTLFN